MWLVCRMRQSIYDAMAVNIGDTEQRLDGHVVGSAQGLAFILGIDLHSIAQHSITLC